MKKEHIEVLNRIVRAKGCLGIDCTHCPLDSRNNETGKTLCGRNTSEFIIAKEMLASLTLANEPLKPKPSKPKRSKPINLGVEWDGVIYTEKTISGQSLEYFADLLEQRTKARDAANAFLRDTRKQANRHNMLLKRGDLT